MKLKKKLIILSILFLFGFGVFFGTFAKGGYFVKADTNITYVDYGTYSINGTTIESDDPYTLNINVSYDEGDQYYTIMLQYVNQVYAIITEDYFYSCAGRETYSAVDNFILTNYRDIESTDFDIDEIISYYDGENYIAEFYITFENFNDNPAYFYINIYMSDIYLDVQGGDIETDIDINFMNYYSYAKIYDGAYNYAYDLGLDAGYDDGYAEGRDDGYAEGYTLGETAGYNDGLDIGYYNGYEVGHYDGYTEGEAYGYTTGLDEGYWYGLDEGLNLSGYKEAYEKGIAKAENTATTWFKGIFNGLQGFLNIEIMGISIGAIILIPVAISFVWFIIRQFRGGGGGD